MIFELAFFPFKIMPKIIRFLIRRIKRSLQRSRQLHSISLRRKEGWLRLAIALALAALISWQLMRSDIKTGTAFTFSCFMAIYSGLIYKSRAAIILVLVAVFLGVLAFSLIAYLKSSIRSGDYIGMGVVLLVMVSIWLWSVKLKWAEVPKEWQEPEVPQKAQPNTRARRQKK